MFPPSLWTQIVPINLFESFFHKNPVLFILNILANSFNKINFTSKKGFNNTNIFSIKQNLLAKYFHKLIITVLLL